jgi:hypothetical protein
MNDLGEVSIVLGIEVHRDRRKKSIRNITKDILRRGSKEI